MARTNKIWILKNKLKAQKQKKVMKWHVSLMREKVKKMSIEEAKQMWYYIDSRENPKWNKYHRRLLGRRWFCEETRHREDPDGYRLSKLNWKLEFVHRPDSWSYRKWLKKQK